MIIWNPWHGCKKISAGCKNCYVYRIDEQFGKDSSSVTKTLDFDLPIKKNKNGEYKLQSKNEFVYVCLTSDFFIEEADLWRKEIWSFIKLRSDLHFIIITKRIHRFAQCIPNDWNDGYDNVTIFCTCENQEMTDYRLPLFIDAPIKHKGIIHEPMLENITIEKYLQTYTVEQVICGGESGDNARICNYDWILNTRKQCIKYNTNFCFRQTGAKFIKNSKLYNIERKYQIIQAKKANIDYNKYDEIKQLFDRLSKSKFRSSFCLKEKDKQYIYDKGWDTIRKHTEAFISERLSPAYIENDGKQTPMKGHPSFIAQHATACCCRGCLAKWYHIPKGIALTGQQQKYIVDIIMEWLNRQINKPD